MSSCYANYQDGKKGSVLRGQAILYRNHNETLLVEVFDVCDGYVDVVSTGKSPTMNQDCNICIKERILSATDTLGCRVDALSEV